MTTVTDLESAAIAYAKSQGYVLPPTPTPPPAPSGDWSWNAQTAALDPNSAALISAFLGYALGSGAYLQCSVATATADASSPAVDVSVSPYGALDQPIYIPAGLKPGMNNDHHVTITDPIHGREHDLWHATVGSNGVIAACNGGASFPLGNVQEIPPGNSNAAGFPLRRGLLTTDDVAAGVIAHPLVFAIPNVGPSSATRFPAVKGMGESGTGIGLGTWLLLDPALNIAALGLPAFDAMVCVALQRYGAFCRDIGSDLSFYAADPMGGGASTAAWKAAVPGLTTDSVGCPIYHFSSLMPWAHLQVLVAPSS